MRKGGNKGLREGGRRGVREEVRGRREEGMERWGGRE